MKAILPHGIIVTPHSALKIQMSEASFNILNDHGGFVIQHRGLVEMKVGHSQKVTQDS